MDAISITRLSDAVHLDVNPGSVKIFGFSREEFIGRTEAELGIITDLRDRKESKESFRRNCGVDSHHLACHDWSLKHESPSIPRGFTFDPGNGTGVTISAKIDAVKLLEH